MAFTAVLPKLAEFAVNDGAGKAMIAETFEQAWAAAALVRVRYSQQDGEYDLGSAKPSTGASKDKPDKKVDNFAGAFPQRAGAC